MFVALDICDFSQDDTLTYFDVMSFYFYFILKVYMCHASTEDEYFSRFCSSYTFGRKYLTFNA